MSRRSESEFFTEWTSSKPVGQVTPASTLSHHEVETELANQLTAKPGLLFDRLVVRRLPNNSICLEGTMHTDDDDFDIADYVKCLVGVNSVINRLHVKPQPLMFEEETVCPGDETVVDW